MNEILSEVMRDPLRPLDDVEAYSGLSLLRAALIEGEESGDAGLLDMDAISQDAETRC